MAQGHEKCVVTGADGSLKVAAGAEQFCTDTVVGRKWREKCQPGNFPAGKEIHWRLEKSRYSKRL